MYTINRNYIQKSYSRNCKGNLSLIQTKSPPFAQQLNQKMCTIASYTGRLFSQKNSARNGSRVKSYAQFDKMYNDNFRNDSIILELMKHWEKSKGGKALSFQRDTAVPPQME